MQKDSKQWGWLSWVLCAVTLLIAVVLYFVTPLYPAFTEYVMSRGVFRILSYPLTLVMSILPFSLTEIVVLAAAPALLTLLGIFIYRLIKRADRKTVAKKGAQFVCWCLSLAALMYMIMHGCNYNRYAVDDLMELNNKRYDAEFLAAVTADLAAKTTAAREQIVEDEDGHMMLSASLTETLALADNAYDNLSVQYPFLMTGTKRVKPVMLSHYWSYTGYTGVYCPWLGESNVNVDVPASELPHTAAHEIAHSMGFAREDACNFLAFAACITSDIPDYVYSGYLSAYIHCSNALYRYSKTMHNETAALLSDGVIRDLKQRNAYWKSFEGDVMESSQEFNDTFIKVNGVESGVLNYNEVVSLILQYYDTKGIIPS